ncbi:MAG: hypothetical protein FJW88_06475 [Actinobacteria bacterium]|nr:hypothetical protein [Actinomycetota bacterium]
MRDADGHRVVQMAIPDRHRGRRQILEGPVGLEGLPPRQPLLRRAPFVARSALLVQRLRTSFRAWASSTTALRN